MKEDKTLSRIRATRRKISAKVGHSIERLGKYYIKRQAQHKHKSISRVSLATAD